MLKSTFWTQLSLFATVFLLVLLGREYVANQLTQNGIEAYGVHTALGIVANMVLIFFSVYLINRNKLRRLAGLGHGRLEKKSLLIFPLVYLVSLNLLIMDDIVVADGFLANILLLVVYVVSIGFAEELSIRGFLQSHFIKHFGKTKKKLVLSVFLSALFFGLIHLIKFDKGLYGELSQMCFASFLGVMFGLLLLITKRIYPLIAIHAIIDFVAKLDAVGVPIKVKVAESMSAQNAIIIVILVTPCLLYSLFLLKRNKLIQSPNLRE